MSSLIPQKANFMVLVKTAKANGCYIYRKSTKRWYTPDEFDADINNIAIRGNRGEAENPASDFAIKSPMEALKYYHSWMKFAADKIIEIQEKIESDYNVEFKPKNK